MSKSILLVDDEEMVTVSLKRVLEKKGYEVTIANDGEEAVELTRGKDFDLIITDIRMPRIDGISTLKIIRQIMEDNGRAQPPEIVITGYARDEYMIEAEKMRVSGCLYKPINIFDLFKTIKSAIGK